MNKISKKRYWLAALPFIFSLAVYTRTSLPLFIYALLSVVGYGLCWFDKRRAEQGGQRISELTLHSVELLGGWPGALLAQYRFRHKTQKRSYRLVVASIIALHALVWALVTYHFTLLDDLLALFSAK